MSESTVFRVIATPQDNDDQELDIKFELESGDSRIMLAIVAMIAAGGENPRVLDYELEDDGEAED